MKKVFLFIMMLFFVSSAIPTSASAELGLKDELCRVTCTIHVSDGFGGSIGISATAGSLFTSCERAAEKACHRAAKKAMSIFL